MKNKQSNYVGPFNLGDLTFVPSDTKTSEKPKEDKIDVCPLCKKGQYICDDCRILGCLHY